MSHDRARSKYKTTLIIISKPFDLKLNDIVFTHGNGIRTRPSRITALRDKQVQLDNSRIINKTGLIAKYVSGDIRFLAPVDIEVADIMLALKDYGRLYITSYSDYARKLMDYKENYQ